MLKRVQHSRSSVYKFEDCYQYILEELKVVWDNGKIQEFSFSLLSQLDEAMKRYWEKKAHKMREESLEISKRKSKLEDEKRMNKIMWNLEEL